MKEFKVIPLTTINRCYMCNTKIDDKNHFTVLRKNGESYSQIVVLCINHSPMGHLKKALLDMVL